MPKMRTNKNICLSCFGTLNAQRVCLTCHKKADDTPAPAHHLAQRTMLAEKYLIDKAIGEGGFGITYLAWDMNRGMKVAVKEYFPSGYVNRMPRSSQVIINSKQNQAASNRGLKRFIDEAKTLAKVKNLAGIVSVRDFFSANGTAYIVMEYLDGVSLKKYLVRKGGRISCDEVLSILRPVMESLVSVHKLGLVHRDISPDNILITKNNEVKLIDFGAAKQSNLDGKSLSIVLKQGFAPEEQYRTHGEQGPWTDIYALGVTIYYCITGTLPPESIQRMYKDTIVRPSEKGAVISPTQESALMKCLAVFAQHRYQDVTQMINGLYGRRGRADSEQSGSESTARTISTENTAVTGTRERITPTPRAAATSTERVTPTPRTTAPTERVTPTPRTTVTTDRVTTPRTAAPTERVTSTTRTSYSATTTERVTTPRATTSIERTETLEPNAPRTDEASTQPSEPEPIQPTRQRVAHKMTLFEKLFGKRPKN